MDTDTAQTAAPNRRRRWFRFNLRTLFIVVTMAALVCDYIGSVARVAVCADTAMNPADDPAYQKWWESHRLEIRDVVEGNLKPDAERAAIASISNDFPAPGDLNVEVRRAFRAAARRNPKALDAVLPRLAKVLVGIRDEREVCSYLDTVVSIGHGPPELVAAVEGVFNSSETYKFAKPRAAAVLFKLNPQRIEMLNWLTERLHTGEPYVRVTVAYALGSLERSAKPVAPKLNDAMRDANPVVRVFAAVALWKADGDPVPVLPVLRKSLSEPMAAAIIRPFYVSEETGLSQKSWAVTCLGEMGPRAGVAADDIAQAINDGDDSELQLEGIRALVKIGRTSPTILMSLEKLSRNSLPGVAGDAKAALEKLRPAK